MYAERSAVGLLHRFVAVQRFGCKEFEESIQRAPELRSKIGGKAA